MNFNDWWNKRKDMWWAHGIGLTVLAFLIAIFLLLLMKFFSCADNTVEPRFASKNILTPPRVPLVPHVDSTKASLPTKRSHAMPSGMAHQSAAGKTEFAKLSDLVPIPYPNQFKGVPGTGQEFDAYDSTRAEVWCVVGNFGDTTFVSVDSLNWHFIHIVVAWLDTSSDKLEFRDDYWKDDFFPQAHCIIPDSCAQVAYGSMSKSSWDIYSEPVDSLKRGYMVELVTYNAMNLYAQKSSRNKTLIQGFWWGPDSSCTGCWNGWTDNSRLTPSIINQIKRMAR